MCVCECVLMCICINIRKISDVIFCKKKGKDWLEGEVGRHSSAGKQPKTCLQNSLSIDAA